MGRRLTQLLCSVRLYRAGHSPRSGAKLTLISLQCKNKQNRDTWSVNSCCAVPAPFRERRDGRGVWPGGSLSRTAVQRGSRSSQLRTPLPHLQPVGGRPSGFSGCAASDLAADLEGVALGRSNLGRGSHHLKLVTRRDHRRDGLVECLNLVVVLHECVVARDWYGASSAGVRRRRPCAGRRAARCRSGGYQLLPTVTDHAGPFPGHRPAHPSHPLVVSGRQAVTPFQVARLAFIRRHGPG